MCDVLLEDARCVMIADCETHPAPHSIWHTESHETGPLLVPAIVTTSE